MKFRYIYLLSFVIILYTSCKKDLGNYTYSPPSEPVIAGLKDGVFPALIGDSLILNPKITISDADPAKDLEYEWRISVQELLRENVYKGYPLRMVYNLGPGERSARLIVTDKRNGLKYTIPFKITGTTQFSVGQLILSSDNGKSKFSFVKPDGTVLPDLYQSLNGEALPDNPVQLYYSKPLAYQLNTKEEYWLLCDQSAQGGVVIDAGTLLKKTFFDAQFFSAPAVISPGYLEPVFYPSQMGTVPNGVVNGKFYVGTQSTAPNADDYGKFGNEQSGDYTMSKYFTHGSNFYFGFNTKAKAFIIFAGDGSYTGSSYPIDAASTGFDPKNVGMDDLLYMRAGDGGTSYAFFKAADGSVSELSFTYPFGDAKSFKALGKRAFKGASLVTAATKWQRSSLNVFYFSSNDKIYRYNPVNEDLKVLDANFGGKAVSMLKISADDNTLTVGVEGSVHTVNVSVGVNGIITKTINGIPGAPVDILIKNL